VVSDDKTLKEAAAPAPVQTKSVGTQTPCHWLQDNKSSVDSKLDLILSILQPKDRPCSDVTLSQDLIQILMDQESTMHNLPVITLVDGNDTPIHTILSAQPINTIQEPVFQPRTPAPSSTILTSETTNTVEGPVFPPRMSAPSSTILTAQTTNTVQEPVLPPRTSAPSSTIPTAQTTNTVQEPVFPPRTPAEAKSPSVNFTRTTHQQWMSTNQATPQPVVYASDQPIFPSDFNTCQPDESSPLMSSTLLSDMSIIAEVKSYSDVLPSHNEVRLDPSLQAEYYNASCSYQNFAWNITKALYHPEELHGRNYHGKRGKLGLSPRRRKTINNALINTYGSQMQLNNAITAINT